MECGIIIDGIPEGAISRKVGLIWGIPDKDLFDEYGVDYPDGNWSHDEYLAAMKRLTH